MSLCEYVSRLKQLPRAMPAVCQLAACDAGLRRGDVGRAARKKWSATDARSSPLTKARDNSTRRDAGPRVRDSSAQQAGGRTELRRVRRRPALNYTSDHCDRRGACVGLPTTTQDQAALSHNAIKLAGTTDHFDALRRFIAVR